MPHLPAFETFRPLVQGHRLVPVYRQLTSDALTPVSAFRHLDDGGSACLFESVVGGEKVGRYTFLAFDPFQTVAAYGKKVVLTRGEERKEYTADDPLDELRD